MTTARIALPLALAVAAAIAVLAVAPRAFEAHVLLAAQDDPVALADHAVARSFDAAVAAREIDAALAAGDADLARSFLELARERDVPVDPDLAEKVALANAGVATAKRSLGSFARGLITGEAEDASGFAGTAVGDLFVLGDVRDVVREGGRLAAGGEADELVLGLACVGLAVTAATYATLGVGVPARVGLTAIKAARQTGRLGAGMAAWIGHSLREAVDWTSAQARGQPCNRRRARGSSARYPRGGEDREGAGARAVRGRCRARAGKRGSARGDRWIEGRRGIARHV